MLSRSSSLARITSRVVAGRAVRGVGTENVLGLRSGSLFKQRVFIGGEFRRSVLGQVTQVVNPANGDIIGAIPQCTAEEIEESIAVAKTAFEEWRHVPAGERGTILREWAKLMRDNEDDLARIMTLESGKPLAESLAENEYSAGFFDWFASEAPRAYGSMIPGARAGVRHVALKEPVGVVGAITPWNFPSAMIARKVGAALAAGCTVVAKPAAKTPFSAFALAVLGERAGVPSGVFNVVTGNSGMISDVLCNSEDVRKITFTGSTEVGVDLMQRCAPTVKRVSMELGGNAPFIVFDDCDMDAALDGIMVAKFRNTGQTCIAANRVFVHSKVHDEFVERLTARIAKLRVGNGLDDGVNLGPLIDNSAFASVETDVADAVKQGATVVCGGGVHEAGPRFFAPTVLTGCTPAMRVFNEETFGPIVPIFRFEDETEVLRLANDTRMGLASYFFSRDHSRIWRVAAGLEYGMVGVNTGVISTAVAPFGGVKHSGVGREGSQYGLEEYIEVKGLTMAM